MEQPTLTRRTFLAGAAAAAASLSLRPAGAAPEKRYLVGGFTKMLQGMSYDELADAAVQIGWDGIECPVRAGGQVLPEKVAEDLPRLADALAKKNTCLLILATDIHDPREPHTESILRAAKKLGITHYRLGQWHYKQGVPVPKQLDAIRAQLTELAALNKELGIRGMFQNHSGHGMVGGPVWDIYEVIKDLDPRSIACHFDIGHATVEGGTAWQTHFQLMQPMLGAVVVKDFTWKVAPNGGGGQARWCPLGEGMVDRRFFTMLKALEWRGPVTLHFEYPVAGKTPAEKNASWIPAMARDTRLLKELLGV